MRRTLSFIMLSWTMAGCAAEAAEEPVGGGADAITQRDAYARIVAAGRFKSGHLACGRTLVVTGGAETDSSGRYSVDVVPCEGEEGSASSETGRFEVVGGWLGGLLSNPTLQMTPDPLGPTMPSAAPWTMKVSINGEAVWLTDEAGTLVPEGMLD